VYRCRCKGGEKVVVRKGTRGMEVNYLSAHIHNTVPPSYPLSQSVKQNSTSLAPRRRGRCVYTIIHNMYIPRGCIIPVHGSALFFLAIVVVSLSPRCKLPLPIRQPSSSRPGPIVNTHFPRFLSPPGSPLSNYRRVRHIHIRYIYIYI